MRERAWVPFKTAKSRAKDPRPPIYTGIGRHLVSWQILGRGHESPDVGPAGCAALAEPGPDSPSCAVAKPDRPDSDSGCLLELPRSTCMTRKQQYPSDVKPSANAIGR